MPVPLHPTSVFLCLENGTRIIDVTPWELGITSFVFWFGRGYRQGVISRQDQGACLSVISLSR